MVHVRLQRALVHSVFTMMRDTRGSSGTDQPARLLVLTGIQEAFRFRLLTLPAPDDDNTAVLFFDGGSWGNPALQVPGVQPPSWLQAQLETRPSLCPQVSRSVWELIDHGSQADAS